MIGQERFVDLIPVLTSEYFYVSVGSSPRSYLFTSGNGPPSRPVRRNFAPSQKSRRNHHSYVWIEALSGTVYVSAQEVSGIVRSRLRGSWCSVNPIT